MSPRIPLITLGGGQHFSFTLLLRTTFSNSNRALEALNQTNSKLDVSCMFFVVLEALVFGSKIDFVGLAFLKIRRENPTMWERLFHVDDFHPSPHGTFLQGCVLHWTLFGCGPENIDYGDGASHLWSDARVMQPPTDDLLPLPTIEEARYLA